MTRSFWVMVFLAVVTLWGQIEREVLRAVDSPFYALLGKELAARPWSDWIVLQAHGLPFFDHPHLTPWLLGLSIKIFGLGTLPVVLTIVLISTLTVILAYLIGKILVSPGFGLGVGTILAFTPTFIKDGRSPMLEPLLMFCITLSVYLHLCFLKKKTGWGLTIATGIAFAAALMAKGPPGVLVLPVLLGFYFFTCALPAEFSDFKVPPKRWWMHFLCVLFTAALLLMILDFWSRQHTGQSFFEKYLATQIQYTVQNGRGATQNDYGYYVPIFLSYYPWIYLILLSFPLMLVLMLKRSVFLKANHLVPAFVLGSLGTVGVFLGFSLIRHKGWWYANIHFVTSSLLAMIPLWMGLQYGLAKKVSAPQGHALYQRLGLFIGSAVVLVSALFPSLFLYPRPIEDILSRAQKKYGTLFNLQKVAVCVDLDGWRGSALLDFYLGAKITTCDQSDAPLKLISLQDPKELNRVVTVYEAEFPYALVKVK
jgi:4-amino-4-deoxy-L-arabinose transferase-like glycosyltransferase